MDNVTDFVIRPALNSDKPSFIELWKICFHDTPEFISWFFRHRWFPSYSFCVEADGQLAAAMQSMPLPLQIRGAVIPGAIVVGVCTLPDYRGRGLMKKMFSSYMKQMRDKGPVAITYHPVDFRIYQSLGHYPVTRTLRYSPERPAEPRFFDDSPYTFYRTEIGLLTAKQLRECFALYSLQYPNYSGIAVRSMELFRLKTRDYSAAGGQAVLCRDESGSLAGYCFFFDSDEEVYGEELMAGNNQATKALLGKLELFAIGKPLQVKVPPDYTASGNPASYTMIPQNAAGITDFSRFLSLLDLGRIINAPLLSSLTVEIHDEILPENNGVYDLSGARSIIPPCLACGIGWFTQVLYGYTTIHELSLRKDAPIVILDKEKAERLNNLLPPCVCFIVDEY